MSGLTPEFLARLMGGMLVNFEIAALAILAGLVVGSALALARLRGGALAGLAATIISLMRAAPTFVVMFFLLNIMPHESQLSGVLTVALSLVPYSAAYVADSGVDAIRHLQRGSRLGALLFLPNLTRAFFVVVMSSGAAAAIGVTEGISIILRQAERLPSLDDRLALFAVGIVLFGIPLQLGFAFIAWIQRRLGRAAQS